MTALLSDFSVFTYKHLPPLFPGKSLGFAHCSTYWHLCCSFNNLLYDVHSSGLFSAFSNHDLLCTQWLRSGTSDLYILSSLPISVRTRPTMFELYSTLFWIKECIVLLNVFCCRPLLFALCKIRNKITDLWGLLFITLNCHQEKYCFRMFVVVRCRLASCSVAYFGFLLWDIKPHIVLFKT